MKISWRPHSVALALALATAVLFAGCRPPSATPASGTPAAGVDLDAVLREALASKRALIVLACERGQSQEDDAASALLKSPAIKARSDRVLPILLDIGVSRNRAAAGRFHVVETPVLFGLSSKGVIVSRDEKLITQNLLSKRMDEVQQQSPGLDAELTALETAAAKEPDNLAAQSALTDFLLAHHNAFEAIPRLAGVAHSAGNPPEARVRAWVDLACAHLWIAEPEKARHEAADLIATLASATKDARAGGELVLGLQDAKGKRFAKAREEFAEAVEAAPASSYGKRAAEELGKLPAASALK